MREETAPPEGGQGGSGEGGGEKRPMVGGRSREEEAALHSSSASSPSLSLSLPFSFWEQSSRTNLSSVYRSGSSPMTLASRTIQFSHPLATTKHRRNFPSRGAH